MKNYRISEILYIVIALISIKEAYVLWEIRPNKAYLFLGFAVFFFQGCTGIPQGIKPIEKLDFERYQGKWYEIARTPNRFETGLEKISAIYTLNPDGTVTVVNRGFNPERNQWKEAIGLAKPVKSSAPGHLKVSFWGPFYSSYIVFELGPDYDYAFVCGYTKEYLWLLARKPKVSEAVWAHFLETAKALGFDTHQLISRQNKA